MSSRAERVVRHGFEVVRHWAYHAGMSFTRRIVKGDSVRVPDVSRGEAVIVTRYREDQPKVALVNPQDLNMLEESHRLLVSMGRLEPIDVDALTLKTLSQEDRPDPAAAIEDPESLKALLGL